MYCIDAEGVKHTWDLGRVDSNLHHSQKLDGHLTFNCTLNSKKDFNHCFRPVFKSYSAGIQPSLKNGHQNSWFSKQTDYLGLKYDYNSKLMGLISFRSN